jgi:hypothetical protein
MSDAAPNTAHPLIRSLRRVFAQPAFVAAVVVLAVAAAGLNVAVEAMQLHFKKLPVPLARSLATLPADLGPWHQVSKDQPLDAEMQQALGTDQYIFRDYVDTRRVSAPLVRQLEELQAQLAKATEPRDVERHQREWGQLLGGIRGRDPRAVINLAVTYYTGLVDTVAHVPDRCYVADGYQPTTYDDGAWPIAPGGGIVPVRFINFEDQANQTSVTKSVAYFFHVNGHFESSPLGVRRSLQNLFEKRGYYAKVEVLTILDNRDESAAVMTDFLSSALPEVQKTLPDWDAVRRGEAAPTATAVSAATTNN